MTSHLRLGRGNGGKEGGSEREREREKTDNHACFLSALEGIWKREPRQTSNAGNESNWEKVCPGSEGCEKVVEGEQLWQKKGKKW